MADLRFLRLLRAKRAPAVCPKQDNLYPGRRSAHGWGVPVAPGLIEDVRTPRARSHQTFVLEKDRQPLRTGTAIPSAPPSSSSQTSFDSTALTEASATRIRDKSRDPRDPPRISSVNRPAIEGKLLGDGVLATSHRARRSSGIAVPAGDDVASPPFGPTPATSSAKTPIRRSKFGCAVPHRCGSLLSARASSGSDTVRSWRGLAGVRLSPGEQR